MRREAMDKLKKWKDNSQKKPLIIFGARQVGKTYLVKEFAKENYDNIYEINFEFEKSASAIFNGDLDIKTLLLQLTTYKPNIRVEEKKTLFFFDEVQKCPQVLTSLKTFAMDGRFDVIVSGSMLGLIMPKVSSYPVGYVETIKMNPLSFKEFLWANNYSDEMIESFKDFYNKGKLVPDAIHKKLNELYLQYIVVGGMPEVVNEYCNTYNGHNVKEIQERILNDYKNDIAKYGSSVVKEKVRECFDSIPDQLAKDNKKFQYKMIKTKGSARAYHTSLNWIIDAGIGIRVNRLKSFELPLKAYRDLNAFKFYLNDTGLLLAFYKQNIYNEIINGNIGVFKGGVFENAIALSMLNNGLDIYYYQKADYLEIDFVTSINNKIIPIEVKSGTNAKSKSLKNVIEKEKLEYGIKLSMNNVNVTDKKIKCYPLYMVMFIKDEVI